MRGLGPALLAALPPVATALGILLGALLVGFSLLPARVRRWSGELVVPLALSTGLLAVGWVTSVAGALLSTRAGVAAAILLILPALRLTPLAARKARAWARRLWALGRAGWPAGLALVAVGAAVIPQLLLPLVDSDGLRYHVALPKLFWLTNEVFRYPFDFAGALPQTTEMLYMLALPLGGGESAKLLHGMAWVAVLAAVATTAHRGRRWRHAAMVAPLALATSPVAAAPAGAAFTDHFALLHVVVALLLVTRGRAVWAGLPLAGVLCAKLTAGPAVAAIALVAVVQAAKGRRTRLAAALVLPSVVALAPWLGRNAVQTGDPFFPLGYGLLGRPIPGASSELREFGAHFNADVPGFAGIAWGPGLARRGDEVVGWHHLAGLASLLLALRFRWARVLAAPVLAYAILGLWFEPPTRYFLPAFAGLAVCEAAALAIVCRRWAPWAGLAATALGGWLVWQTQLTVFQPVSLLGGALEREAYLRRTVPGFGAAQVVNRLEPGGRVMALDFPTPYYFNRPWIAEGTYHEPPIADWLRQARSASELLDRLQAEDVTVLVVTPGYGGGTARSLVAMGADVRQTRLLSDLRDGLELEATVDGVDVYRVPRQ